VFVGACFSWFIGFALISDPWAASLAALKEPQLPPLPYTTVRRIELTVTGAPGIPGPICGTTMILSKEGPCRATTRIDWFSFNSPGRCEEKEYELPSEMFEECRALLIKTGFRYMKPVSQPDKLFENSSTSVNVKCEEEERCVTVIHPATPPSGYDDILAFVHSVVRRGKVVKPNTSEDAPSDRKP
jgi:hypothetical protein